MSSTVLRAVFTESWRYAGWTSTQESAAGGVVDSSGNLVLCGKSNGLAFNIDDDTITSTADADFSAVKLEGESGEQLWSWVDSSLEGADWMVSAGADSESNVVLGGFTNGDWDAANPDGFRDIAAVKLTAEAGTEIWRYQTVSRAATSSSGSKGFGVSYVLGVSVDVEDNPVLVGTTFNSLVEGAGTPGDWDFFAIKLDGATGAELWVMQGGVAFTREGLLGAKMDPSGDLVAAGYTANEDAGELNFLVVKLSGSDGSILWEYAPSTASGDMFHSVDLDERANVFVAGGEGAPNLQGKTATTPVVLKLNGITGEEMWTYRGSGGDRIIFKSVAVDPITGWVVGAGGTLGDWVEGASQGGFDFAAVVLNGDSGEELTRWQDGTIGDDVVEFVQFDSTGELFVGGFSSAAWVGEAGDEDFIAIKFAPLATNVPRTAAPSSALTSSQTAGPTGGLTAGPTFSPTPGPTTSPTAVPSVAPTSFPSPAARDNSTLTTVPAAVSAVESGSGSSAALDQWAVGGITIGGVLCFILLWICLCYVRRKAEAQMAEMDVAKTRALQVLPVPSTKPQRIAFSDIYPADDDDAPLSSQNAVRAGLGAS